VKKLTTSDRWKLTPRQIDHGVRAEGSRDGMMAPVAVARRDRDSVVI
jgi:hypothetical protein